MKETSEAFVPVSIQNHRRRRAKPHQPKDVQQQQQLKGKIARLRDDENCSSHYYDEDLDDDKGHRHGEDRIFEGSCSFGKFVLNPCLCLCDVIRTLRFRRRRKMVQVLLVLLYAIIVILSLPNISGSGYQNIRRFFMVSSRTSSGRALSDDTVNQIPITIPIFDFDGEDIGGWAHLRRFFQPTLPLDPGAAREPDFGGLSVIEKRDVDDKTLKKNNKKNQRRMLFASSLHSKQLLSTERTIHPDDERIALEYWDALYDNDYHLHSYDKHPEEREAEDLKCRPTNWARRYYPQCNSIHEIALFKDYDQERAKSPGYDETFDSFYISHGYYRDVWVINQHLTEDVKSVLKIMRWKHPYGARAYWNTLADAMVMERLTASPRIVDIYGHCGTAVWVEAIPNEVEEVIVPGEGMAKQEDLYKDGLESFNDYTVEEKLDMALSMAESLADLHGFRDGVIVHDDVQLCQWLRTKDGRIKLGDFNRAEVMEYDLKKKKYCRYINGGCYGNYRAPEEYDSDYLNEAIDVFSFGNNIYSLLTGLWVFYDTDDDPSVQEKVINGTRALIDPRWKKRSFIEAKLVEVMEQCWIHNTDKRMDIFQAVQKLREIKTEYESGKTKK